MSQVVPGLLGTFGPNHVAHTPPSHYFKFLGKFLGKEYLIFEACDSHELVSRS